MPPPLFFFNKHWVNNPTPTPTSLPLPTVVHDAVAASVLFWFLVFSLWIFRSILLYCDSYTETFSSLSPPPPPLSHSHCNELWQIQEYMRVCFFLRMSSVWMSPAYICVYVFVYVKMRKKKGGNSFFPQIVINKKINLLLNFFFSISKNTASGTDSKVFLYRHGF